MDNNKKIKTVSEQTGISVRELNRLNQDLWYHGTTIEDAENIHDLGIIADYNIGAELDFGPGFYLTDSFQRATSYISRIPLVTPDGNMEFLKEWAIITFSFNPFELLFTDHSQYMYRNFAKHNEEFSSFVFYNRLFNTRKERHHNFDIIWGVMSDNAPLKLISDYKNEKLTEEETLTQLQKPNSMRQLYIGNQDICNKLEIQQITKGGIQQ